MVTRTDGDCLARLEVLLEQTHVSLDLAQCVPRPAGRAAAGAGQRQAAQGPARCPRATVYTATENPLGFNGYYLVSRGEKTPWRLKLRSASFNNVSVLGEMLPGNLIADMVAILGSMFFVVGDIDK